MIRDIRSDYLKALAIFGVVAIHSEFPHSEIFRFCVPVFIGLWAMYFEKSISRGTSKTSKLIKTRLFSLLVPYFFWTFLYIAIFTSPAALLALPIHTIVGGFFGGTGWAGQYFLIILFQWTIIFPLFRMIVDRDNVWMWIIGSLVFDAFCHYVFFPNTVMGKVGYRLFIYWIPFVTIGISLSRGYVRANSKLLPLSIIALLCTSIELKYLGIEPSYLSPSVALASIMMLIAAGAKSDLVSSRKFELQSLMSPTAPIISYVGKNTYPIFVSNILVLHLLPNFGLGYGPKLATVIATLLGCLALGWSIQKTRLGILIGK
jgi:fucose 4-O-acetylase-like acetyltransferase